MYELEIAKELTTKRRDILEKIYNSKQSIDLLLQKDFFKELISFYQWMDKIEGLSSWMSLYQSYLLDPNQEDCDDCISGKMRLIEMLMFKLRESEILERIEELNNIYIKYKELQETCKQ